MSDELNLKRKVVAADVIRRISESFPKDQRVTEIVTYSYDVVSDEAIIDLFEKNRIHEEEPTLVIGNDEAFK